MTSIPQNYVAILDVGHGSCCVVSDNGITSVIDAGPGASLLRFLDDRKIYNLEFVILSHADYDHIAGLVKLLATKEFRINRVILNTDSQKNTKIWKNLANILDEYESEGKLAFSVNLTASEMNKFTIGGVNCDILAPSNKLAMIGVGGCCDGTTLTAHSLSAVIHLSKNGDGIASILGDIDSFGLEQLKDKLKGKSYPVSVLVYPHHGGANGSDNTSQFISSLCEIFSPKIIIFSIGRGKFQNPRPEIINKLKSIIPNVRIACTQLSEHCASNLDSLDTNHLLPVYSEGSRENCCCAGTLIINIDSHGSLEPNDVVHKEFISRNALTALCINEITIT